MHVTMYNLKLRIVQSYEQVLGPMGSDKRGPTVVRYVLPPTLICDMNPQNWFYLIIHDRTFHKNALSNFTITVDLGKAVCFC